MSVAKLAYGVADYIKVEGAFELMRHFTSVNESPNAETEETQYTVDKSKTTDTVGYATSWGFEGILQASEESDEGEASPKAIQFLETIGKEQKLGADCQTEFVRVELDNPTLDGGGTKFYARMAKVAVEVTELSVEAGAKRGISGNLNALGDIKVGTFDTSTKQFTPAEE